MRNGLKIPKTPPNFPLIFKKVGGHFYKYQVEFRYNKEKKRTDKIITFGGLFADWSAGEVDYRCGAGVDEFTANIVFWAVTALGVIVYAVLILFIEGLFSVTLRNFPHK